MVRQVYFVEAKSVNLIKIGSSLDPDRRFAELQLLSPVPLEIICCTDGGSKREAELHEQFSHLRSHGEWFHATGDLLRFISRERVAAAKNSFLALESDEKKIATAWFDGYRKERGIPAFGAAGA